MSRISLCHQVIKKKCKQKQINYSFLQCCLLDALFECKLAASVDGSHQAPFSFVFAQLEDTV